MQRSLSRLLPSATKSYKKKTLIANWSFFFFLFRCCLLFVMVAVLILSFSFFLVFGTCFSSIENRTNRRKKIQSLDSNQLKIKINYEGNLFVSTKAWCIRMGPYCSHLVPFHHLHFVYFFRLVDKMTKREKKIFINSILECDKKVRYLFIYTYFNRFFFTFLSFFFNDK